MSSKNTRKRQSRVEKLRSPFWRFSRSRRSRVKEKRRVGEREGRNTDHRGSVVARGLLLQAIPLVISGCIELLDAYGGSRGTARCKTPWHTTHNATPRLRVDRGLHEDHTRRIALPHSFFSLHSTLAPLPPHCFLLSRETWRKKKKKRKKRKKKASSSSVDGRRMVRRRKGGGDRLKTERSHLTTLPLNATGK